MPRSWAPWAQDRYETHKREKIYGRKETRWTGLSGTVTRTFPTGGAFEGRN